MPAIPLLLLLLFQTTGAEEDADVDVDAEAEAVRLKASREGFGAGPELESFGVVLKDTEEEEDVWKDERDDELPVLIAERLGMKLGDPGDS